MGEKLDLERQSDVIAPFARRVAEAARLYSVRAPSAWVLDSVSSGSVTRSDRHKTVELVDEESWPSDESDELGVVPEEGRQRARPTLVLDFGRAVSAADAARCSQFCRLPPQLLPPPAAARRDTRPMSRFPSIHDAPAEEGEAEADGGAPWLQAARDLDAAGLPPIALAAAGACQPCGFRSAVLCALAARQRPRKAPPEVPSRPPAKLPARREIVRPKTPPSPLPPPPPPRAASESAVAQELVLRAAAAVRRAGCPSREQNQQPPLQAVPSGRYP